MNENLDQGMCNPTDTFFRRCQDSSNTTDRLANPLSHGIQTSTPEDARLIKSNANSILQPTDVLPGAV